MPFILTGVRQAVALGLIGVVVGEMFGGSEGIGYMVNYGGQTFQTDTVFLGVVIIALRRHRADVARRAAGKALFALATGTVRRSAMDDLPSTRISVTIRESGRVAPYQGEVMMAEIVLGIGSSHGPLLSTPPEQWDLRAKADRENKSHWFRGKTYDYESLLKERAPGFADEVTVEVRRERFAQCRARPGSARARNSTRSRPTRWSSSATTSASSSIPA